MHTLDLISHGLKAIAKKYPTAWEEAEYFRHNQMFAWPTWCYLPMGGWHTIISRAGKVQMGLEQLYDLPILAAYGQWRLGKGVYRFDPDLFQALYDCPPTGDLPAEVLLRLPEYCVFIEIPSELQIKYLNVPIAGFFAHLNCDLTNAEQKLEAQLHFLISDENGQSTTAVIYLDFKSIEEGIQKFIHDSNDAYREHDSNFTEDEEKVIKEATRDISGLVSLVLYLCSDEPDVIAPKGGKSHAPKIKSSNNHKGLIAPPNPKIWTVGAEFGKLIKKENEREEGAERGIRNAPRPHLRRGHWHGYWLGPRKEGKGEERKYSLKWISPLIVGK